MSTQLPPVPSDVSFMLVTKYLSNEDYSSVNKRFRAEYTCKVASAAEQVLGYYPVRLFCPEFQGKALTGKDLGVVSAKLSRVLKSTEEGVQCWNEIQAKYQGYDKNRCPAYFEELADAVAVRTLNSAAAPEPRPPEPPRSKKFVFGFGTLMFCLALAFILPLVLAQVYLWPFLALFVIAVVVVALVRLIKAIADMGDPYKVYLASNPLAAVIEREYGLGAFNRMRGSLA